MTGEPAVADAGELRVLLVEDSPTDAKLVLDALRGLGRPIETARVDTADAMRGALAAGRWDIVLSDWSMPSFSAPAALAIVKQSGLDVPFVIVSGTVGEDTAVDAMRAGAHDYVLKDKLARLVPAVERELRECAGRVARRRADLDLQASQARFRRLAESGIIGIVIADVNGNVFEANDAYLAMVGYSRSDLEAGKIRWTDLSPLDQSDLAAASLRRLLESGVAAPFEAETLRRDGTRVPLLIGVAMLEHPLCIAFTTDLTERKKAEEGRRRAEEALRSTEEQFRQAQKMEAVGRLAGGVAHDFNNVLSVILSYADLMLGDLAPGAPLRDEIQEIRKAAMRAASLTQQLLLFSRQQVLEPKVVDVNAIIANMGTMLVRLVGEDVELVTKTTPSAARVLADPGSIEQVVMNLVVNARDAMPVGGMITIETGHAVLDAAYARDHLGVTPGPHVMLAVSDNGTGMDKATQARIFEPFFTTKEVGKGTGLGLSTVFGIIKQSGGTVWVSSEPGRGTSFKVYLPRAEGAVTQARAPAAPTTLRGSETVLVVEDEEQVRAVARGILERQGYRVLHASDGDDAMAICATYRGAIDLLVSDVVMPKLSGPELAKRLTVDRPLMKVLCMSGYTDDAVVRHGALDAGIAFIQKPFTAESLARKVREVLDAR